MKKDGNMSNWLKIPKTKEREKSLWREDDPITGETIFYDKHGNMDIFSRQAQLKMPPSKQPKFQSSVERLLRLSKDLS